MDLAPTSGPSIHIPIMGLRLFTVGARCFVITQVTAIFMNSFSLASKMCSDGLALQKKAYLQGG